MAEKIESLTEYGALKVLNGPDSAGYMTLFMPELADELNSLPLDSELLRHWYTTPSIVASGDTKRGNRVVIYAHVANELERKLPETAKQVKEKGFVSQAGLERLIEMDGYTEGDNRKVWVQDYKNSGDDGAEFRNVSEALKHPQTIPFYGGEERAKKTLQRRFKIYQDPLQPFSIPYSEEGPMAKFLTFGYHEFKVDGSVSGHGRVLGIPLDSEEGRRLVHTSFPNGHPPRIS